ncbi:MAG: type II toxin-antitoxin system VapC family toxin [Micrococcales bacterium]|nr:type II toxin-antitoxin system VapC family toxin [Micrococcales bacterium]
MYLLDTNVVSEVVRTQPSPAVMRWMGTHDEPFATTAVTIGELITGVRLLPQGVRRAGLLAAIEEVLLRWSTCLPYDESAARTYAAMRELARRLGRGLSVEDGMIAASCAVNNAVLATRNTIDFDFLPVSTINPWHEDPT